MKVNSFEDVKKLTPRQFEYLGKKVLEKIGHKKAYVTKYYGDNGIDVISEYNKEKYYTQCKKWNKGAFGKNIMPVKEIRELGGCMLRDDIKKGIMFTTLEIDERCRKEGIKMGIMGIGKKEIIEILELKENSFNNRLIIIGIITLSVIAIIQIIIQKSEWIITLIN